MSSILELDIQNITGNSKDANGFLAFVIDGYGEHGSVPITAIHPHGFWSCPLDPTVDPGSGEPIPSTACSILTLTEGGVTHGMPLTDPRAIDALPLGLPGETMVYSSFGSFERHHADGAITLSTTTTGGSAAGQTVAERITPTSFLRFAPWGQEKWDAMGYRMKHVGGASLVLGYAGGLIPGLNSTASLSGDIVRISGTAVGIGPKTAPQMPVAQVLPLITLLQTILATVEALSGGLAGIVITAPAASAAAPVIALAQAALLAAPLTIATQTAVG